MQLSEELFNTFLGNVGVVVTWSRASECPCRVARTGGTNVDCPVCEGLRYVWDGAVETRIGLTGLKIDRQFGQMVEWQKGDALATIPSDSPAYVCGEYDRFMVTDGENRFNAVLTKGKDRLKHNGVKAIERVFSVMGGNVNDYQEWDHYEMNGRELVWHPSAGIPEGTQYSVRYVASPEYFVYRDLPQDRPQFSLDLPRKVPLRLMDLFSQVVQ